MRLEVDTGNPLHLVRDGKERPTLVVRNPAARAVSWRTAFVFRDVFGRRFEIPFAREMAAGEETRVEVPWPLPAKGLWRVAANVTGGDGSHAYKETRFAFIDRHERTPIVEKPKYRYALVEADTIPIAEQERLYRTSQMPIAALVYSGDFLISADENAYGSTRLTLGLNPRTLCWRLSPGLSRPARSSRVATTTTCGATSSGRLACTTGRSPTP